MKWLLVLGVVTMLLAALNLVLLLDIRESISRSAVAPLPASARWTDVRGLEQLRQVVPLAGESDDSVNTRLRDLVAVALRYFPAKE